MISLKSPLVNPKFHLVLILNLYYAKSIRLDNVRRVLSASFHMIQMFNGRVERLICTVTSKMKTLWRIGTAPSRFGTSPNYKLKNTLVGHGGYVNNVAISPDGSLCASNRKDGVTMLWDISEGKRLYSLDIGDIIYALCFSPNKYWPCAATQQYVKIWDLESKSIVVNPRFRLFTFIKHFR